MPKYAIVITADERFLPGYNGMLNAIKYYGFDNKVEVHLVHSIPERSAWLPKAADTFPNLKLIRIEDLRKEYFSKYHDAPGSKRSKSIMKYWRWWYPVERLGDYDAICVLDADRQIVNDLTPYFDLTAASDKILLAKNDFSDAEAWAYGEKRAMMAQPPLYSNPYFITGKRLLDIFPLIPKYAENPRKYTEYSRRAQTGDMHPVNLTLIHTGMIDDVHLLPATQWVFVQTDHVKLSRRIVARRQYLGLHGYGDLLYTYHRKYWGQRTCDRVANGHSLWGLENGINNVKLFWEFTKFFNTELDLQIDWVYGDLPDTTEKYNERLIRFIDAQKQRRQ